MVSAANIIRNSYCKEAKAYFAACTVQPTPQRKTLLDSLIFRPLKDWYFPKCDRMYIEAAHDNQAARIAINNPSAAALVVNGTMTFAANLGYTGGGAAGDFLDTATNLSAWTLFLQDSAHMGVWSTTDLANGGARSYELGGHNATNRSWFARSVITATRVVTAPNFNGSLSETVNGYFPGHVAWVRTASNAWSSYGQGVALESGTDASSALQAVNTRIHSATGIGSGVNQLAMAFIGGGLIAAEMKMHFDICQRYLRAIGAA